MRFHADDFGASPWVTEAILQCHEAGAISSCSVLVNREAFQESLRRLGEYPDLELSLHLNLTDGSPLCSPLEIPALCSDNGLFHHRFDTLAWSFLSAGHSERNELKRQISLELRAQCRKFTECLEILGRPLQLRLDSHEHLHFLPFVLDIVVEMKDEFNLVWLRLPNKVFYLAHFVKFSPLMWLKQGLLNLLGRMGRSRYKTAFEYPQCLLTGSINPTLLGQRSWRESGEVLFHPGRIPAHEHALWDQQERLRAVYSSEFREREHLALLDYGSQEGRTLLP